MFRQSGKVLECFGTLWKALETVDNFVSQWTVLYACVLRLIFYSSAVRMYCYSSVPRLILHYCVLRLVLYASVSHLSYIIRLVNVSR